MSRPFNLNGGRPRARKTDRHVYLRLEGEVFNQISARALFLNSNKTEWITKAIVEKLAREDGVLVLMEDKKDEQDRPDAGS